jgi:DNA-binding transcriptional LysR family regulator
MELGYSRKCEPPVDWDDYRVFAAVAKAASLKRAALLLGTTQSSVGKRIDRLEESLGTRLFDRGPTGAKLTFQGERILPHVTTAQRELALAQGQALNASARIDGDCTLLTMDGIANYWIARFLPAFYDHFPHIELKLTLGHHELSAPRNDIYDIRLHYFEPANSEQIAKQVATVHFIPFASRSYIEKYGMPQTREDLANHRILDSSQYLTSSASWAAWFGADIEKEVSLFTNQSSFLARCVASGTGIALMPSYMALVDREFVALDLDIVFRTKLFVNYHRERVLKPQVKTTLWFLRNIVFDPASMPWFADEFLCPTPEWAEAFGATIARSTAFEYATIEPARA